MKAETIAQEARAAEDKAKETLVKAEAVQREFQTKQTRSQVNRKTTLYRFVICWIYIPMSKAQQLAKLGHLALSKGVSSAAPMDFLLTENSPNIFGFSLCSIVIVLNENHIHLVRLLIYRFLPRNWTMGYWIRTSQVKEIRCIISMVKVIW